MDSARRLVLNSGIALLLLGCKVSASAKRSNSNPKRLLELLRQEEIETPIEELSPLFTAVIDAGESIVPALVAELGLAIDRDHKYRICSAIAYAGGTLAVDTLRDFYLKQQEVGSKSLLCFAIPSAPSEWGIRFLIEALKVEPYGDESAPGVVSAYGLGIMRTRAALPELQACANVREGAASFAAALAIKWITEIPQQVTIELAASNDDLIAAIVESGLLEIEQVRRLRETGSMARIWTRSATGWVVQRSDQSESVVPELSFNAYRSTDGARALVNVGIQIANMHGAGFDYILHRVSGVWKVRALLPTWQS